MKPTRIFGSLLLAASALAGDNAAPKVAITAPASPVCTNQPTLAITVAFQAQGNVQDLDLLRGTTLLETFTNKPSVKSGTKVFTAQLASLAEGTYNFQARAFQGNRNANLSGLSNVLSVMIDRTAPKITNLLPANNSCTKNPHPAFSATFSDVGCGVDTARTRITLDGADVAAQATAQGFTFTPAANLPDGEHILGVFLFDKAGNSTSASTRIMVDTVPSQIAGLTPPDGSFLNNTGPLIAATYSDMGCGIDVAAVHLRLDGTEVTSQATVSATGISFTPASPLIEGSHTVVLTVADLATNPASAQAHWTVDLSTPSVSVVSPTDGEILTSATPTLVVAYSDSLSGVDLSSLVVMLDGMDKTSSFTKGAAGATWALDIPNALADGSHTLTARILDKAGNEGAAQSHFTVQTVQPDTTPPIISLVFPKPTPFGDPTAFEGTAWRMVADARDPGPNASGIKKVEFLVDGMKVAEDLTFPYEVTVQFPSGIAGQSKVLSVVAEDLAGNRTTSSSQAITFIPRPASGAVVFRVSGAPASIQAGQALPGPITIEAVDAQGNVDPNYTGTILFFTSDPNSSINDFFFADFSAANHGVIQVDFAALLDGQPPLLTVGQQVIAVADVSNPARDQGVISVNVHAGPPAIVDFTSQTRQATPHGGNSFSAEVFVADAFGNSISGVQVQLQVFENNALTQTLTGTTASPVSFPVAIGGSTDRLKLRASTPALPSLPARELKRLVDASAVIEDFPQILTAGQYFTATFSVLNRDGVPIPDVDVTLSAPVEPLKDRNKVPTPFGTPETHTISAPFQKTTYLTLSNVIQTLRLDVPDGPLTATRTAFVRSDVLASEPIVQSQTFYSFNGMTVRIKLVDRFGNPLPYEPMEVEVSFDGEILRQFVQAGSDGTAALFVGPRPHFLGFPLASVTTTVTLQGTGRVSTFTRVLNSNPDPRFNPKFTTNMKTFQASSVADLDATIRWDSPPGVFTLQVIQGIVANEPSLRHKLNFSRLPTIATEGPGGYRLETTADTINIFLVGDAQGHIPTAITVSNISVQTNPFVRGFSSELLSLLIPHNFLIDDVVAQAGIVFNPGIRLFGESQRRVDLLSEHPYSTSVVMVGDSSYPVPGPTGVQGGLVAPMFAAVVADPRVYGDSITASLRSLDAQGLPVQSNGVPTETSLSLWRVSDSLYMSRRFRVADADEAPPMVPITPSDTTDFQTVAGEPGGTILLQQADFGSASSRVFGFDGTVKVVLGAGEPAVPGEGGARPLPYSVFKDVTPEIRLKAAPGFTLTSVFIAPDGNFLSFREDSTGQDVNVPQAVRFLDEATGRELIPETGGGEVLFRFGVDTPNPVPLRVAPLTLRIEDRFGRILGRIRCLPYTKDQLDPQSQEVLVAGGWAQEAFDGGDKVHMVHATNEEGVEEDQWVLERRLRLSFKTDDPTTPANEAVTDHAISDLLRAQKMAPMGLDRDKGLVSVRTRRALKSADLIAARDNPPGQPDVEKAGFVRSIEFVQRRYNKDGNLITDAQANPVVSPERRFNPLDMDLLDRSIRQGRGEETGTAVQENPYRLELALDAPPNSLSPDLIHAKLTRHSNGQSVLLDLQETGNDTLVFSGTSPDASVEVMFSDLDLDSARVDGITLRLVSNAFGIPFHDNKNLIETGLNTLRFKEIAFSTQMTALGGISAATMDTLGLSFTSLNGTVQTVALTESSATSNHFTGGGFVLDLFSYGGLAAGDTVPGEKDSYLGILSKTAASIVDEPLAFLETGINSLLFRFDVDPDSITIFGGNASDPAPSLTFLERRMKEQQEFFLRVVSPEGNPPLVLDSINSSGSTEDTVNAPVGSVGQAYFQTIKPILAAPARPTSAVQGRYGDTRLFLKDDRIVGRVNAAFTNHFGINIAILGDSISAGMNSLSLREDFQRNNYAAVLSKQVGPAIPYRKFPFPGRPRSLWDTAKNRLEVDMGMTRAQLIEWLGGVGSSNPDDTPLNFAVPGVEIRHVTQDLALIPDPDLPTQVTNESDLLTRLAREIWRQSPGASTNFSALRQAKNQDPSLVIVWLGNNDAQEAMNLGQVDARYLTPVDPPGGTFQDFDGSLQPGFKQSLDRILEVLREDGSAKPDIIFVNLGDVTQSPTFLPVNQAFGQRFPFSARLVRNGKIRNDFIKVLEASQCTTQVPQGEKASFRRILNAAPIPFGAAYLLAKRDITQIQTIPFAVPNAEIMTTPNRLTIQARIADYNQAIATAVTNENLKIATDLLKPNPILLVDAAQLFRDLAAGPTIAGKAFTLDWKGGVFCLDGLHPTFTGQALIANKIIKTVREAAGLDGGTRLLPPKSEVFGGLLIDRWKPLPEDNPIAPDDLRRLIARDPMNKDR